MGGQNNFSCRSSFFIWLELRYCFDGEMMKKQKPVYKGVEFDSREEIEFYMWLDEAANHGLIFDGFTYQPMPYELSSKRTRLEVKQLKTKTKKVEKHLLHPHKYTADFQFRLTMKGERLNIFIADRSTGLVVVDVKGGFNQHGGDREFSINQKWVFDKYGVYVNKVVPEKLFEASWCPVEARLTEKTRQVKKKYENCRTIEEFLK